jgi:hypothetical protein
LFFGIYGRGGNMIDPSVRARCLVEPGRQSHVFINGEGDQRRKSAAAEFFVFFGLVIFLFSGGVVAVIAAESREPEKWQFNSFCRPPF